MVNLGERRNTWTALCRKSKTLQTYVTEHGNRSKSSAQAQVQPVTPPGARRSEFGHLWTSCTDLHCRILKHLGVLWVGLYLTRWRAFECNSLIHCVHVSQHGYPNAFRVKQYGGRGQGSAELQPGDARSSIKNGLDRYPHAVRPWPI